MTSGKRFENNFKKSVPDDVFYYRFKDGTSSWDGGNARFQAANICDCMLFKDGNLFLLELKNHKGKSFPFSCIRDNQLKELCNADKYGTMAGFVINFQDVEETYYCRAIHIKKFMELTDRKSIPISWLIDNGIKIQATKLKTNYKYDISKMIKEIGA